MLQNGSYNYFNIHFNKLKFDSSDFFLIILKINIDKSELKMQL